MQTPDRGHLGIWTTARDGLPRGSVELIATGIVSNDGRDAVAAPPRDGRTPSGAVL